MYAQTSTEVTAVRAVRKRRYDDVAQRSTPQSRRGAAPPRSEFSQRRRRFVDQNGRVYVLPIRGDPVAQRLIEVGEVGAFYEPDYVQEIRSDASAGGASKAQTFRRGFAYKAARRELPDLSGTVFMYCMRPTTAVQHDDTQGPARLPAMPPVQGSGTDEPLRLYQCDQSNCIIDDGERYTAYVRKTVGKRRAQRGQVILENVQMVN